MDEEVLARGGTFFALRVKGESMIEAGILSGDYVIVRQQPSVENGEIAAALLDHEATVKRIYREADYVRLQPANAQMAPLLVREVQLLGKVVSVLRQID